jgi:hypothetical protein
VNLRQIQRQQASRVFQQHNALVRSRSHQRSLLRRINLAGRFMGMIEYPALEHHSQNPPHIVVNRCR